MLACAFRDEMKDIFPDPVERRRKEPIANEFYLRRDSVGSHAFVTSPKLEGIAIWRRSDQKRYGAWWRMLVSGAIWLVPRLGLRSLLKMHAGDHMMEQKHRRLMPQKHWYLAVLAVDPPHQGQGHGSRLVREMMALIDEEGLPCYVETEGQKNIAMYRRYGFEPVDELVVPGTTETITAMIRPARKAAA
jgi:GNAT superfamily N-acetyltransferase